jgi:exosortase D (VPLPA-CTERM-specific)
MLWTCLAVLLAGWVGLFWSHFPDLFSRWNSEDLSYCFIIPLLAGYLGYRNIQDRGYLPFGDLRWPGLLPLALAGLLYLAGRVGSLETFVYGAMWLSLVGVVVTILGTSSLKTLGFPLFLMIFAVPPPPFIVNMLSFKLRLVSSQLSMFVFHGLNIPAFREGNIIDLGITQLQVVEACSGLRYLFPIIVIGLVMGHLFRLGILQRLLLLVCCLPLVVAANTLRIVMMGLGVKQGMSGLLQGPTHDIMGLALFILSAALLGGLAWILEKSSGSNTKDHTQHEVKYVPGSSNPRSVLAGYTAAGVLIFLLAWFASPLLVSATNPPCRQCFDAFPTTIGGWTGHLSTLSQEIEDTLWADDYVTGTYYHPQIRKGLHILIPYYSYQTVRHTAHAPTSCLLGGGFDLLSKKNLQPAHHAGRDFAVRQMVLSRHDGRVLSNFWFEQRGRIITNEYMNKLYLIWDGLTKQRTDGALVRVEMAMNPGQSTEEAQAVLDPFLGQLRDILNSGFVPE